MTTEGKVKKKYFNFFDIVLIGIVLALAVAFLMWQNHNNSASIVTNTTAKTVRYTIEIAGMENGAEQLIRPGDTIVDDIKRSEMGRVISVESEPTTWSTRDMETGIYSLSEVSWQKTATIELEADCNESDSEITTVGGFAIHVGDSISVRGPGYAGNGTVMGIERED